ncbi:MAG TPA: CoA transferase [Flavobacteriales bacterium]|nr:CoA transferase [Flavobacteriales bacterium]
MSIKPLDGIRVLDLSRLLPGPMCTLHLGDLGADVIKIEDPVVGDYARAVPPLNKNNSTFFLSINRNKRSMALDLSNAEGVETFMKLAKTADVIVESYRPGVVKKIGVDYEAVCEVNPKIIYCSITGYGQTGPYSEKAGHDLNFIGLAGILKAHGDTLQIPNFLIGDIVGGAMTAAMAILAALVQKGKTGEGSSLRSSAKEGQFIDVALFDGVMAHTPTSLAHLGSLEKLGIDTSDMLCGALHCYNIYKCKDGKYMALGALEFKFWKVFCEAIGRSDLSSNHITTEEKSIAIKNELDVLFLEKARDEWVTYFENVDCCISPVLDLSESIENKQVKARKMILTTNHPLEGDLKQFSLPYQSSGFEFELERHAPQLGQHTEEILKELKRIG